MELHERLSALIQPSRARIMRLLTRAELSGGEVSRVTQGAQSTTSRHLKALTESGWVGSRRVGNTVMFGASDQLGELERSLWEALEREFSARWPDDSLRLEVTLRERKPNSRDYFGRIGARWEEVRRELYGEHSLAHLAFSMLPRAQVIADLGCGSGGVLELLAPHVDRLIGVDREPAMLEAARERVASFAHVEVRGGELESPPLTQGEIDLALFNLVLHLVDSPVQVLTAACDALSDIGRVVIIDMVAHDREEYRRSMGHISLGFSEDDLSQCASRAGLCLTHYQTLPPDLTASGPALFAATLELKSVDLARGEKSATS